MREHSSHVLELAKRGAALRLGELVNELNLLLRLFPDLRDAFDADELPVSFIVKRDARCPDATAVTPSGSSPSAVRTAVNRRMKQAWTARRAGSKA